MNGKELTDGDNFTISKDETKGIYKLTIKKVSLDVSGDIKFEASNIGGKAESQGKLSLLRKSLSFYNDNFY